AVPQPQPRDVAARIPPAATSTAAARTLAQWTSRHSDRTTRPSTTATSVFMLYRGTSWLIWPSNRRRATAMPAIPAAQHNPSSPVQATPAAFTDRSRSARVKATPKARTTRPTPARKGPVAMPALAPAFWNRPETPNRTAGSRPPTSNDSGFPFIRLLPFRHGRGHPEPERPVTP